MTADYNPYCTFCRIARHEEPGDFLYEDDRMVVIRNLLRWVPVMLLAIPRRHMSQEDLWHDMDHIARVAAEMGARHCPSGFRLLSNFGPDAMQSQSHGHLHIIGGTYLGPYA